jgi:uncharacterized protein (TIGR02147 family)
MTLFQYSDYRRYLRDWVRQLPKEGRGEFTKIAKRLGVNTTLISQVLSGTRNFNEEQAFELSTHIGHSAIETEYFALLVRMERAGSANLKTHLEKKRAEMAQEARKLTHRVAHERELTEQERALFYSSWVYSGIHLFTSTKNAGVTAEEIAARFQLPRARVAEIMQFLHMSGLVTQKQNRFQMGTQSTMVGQGSPYLIKHHTNWRVKAIQRAENLQDEEMMYSGQFSLSRRDFEGLRETFAQLLKSTNEVVMKSPAEEVACLNLDWFWLD